jgi:D-tyrosyl-tRNA(Tyr) deacylase
MRALIQRVTNAKVDVEGACVGQIGPGLMILICAMHGDSPSQSTKLAEKISKLRIFRDDAGKMNRSLLDTGGSALIISQFTLAGDTSRGNRPGFSSAAPAQDGHALYDHFTAQFAALGIPVANGVFGADMAVTLTNDGPVTLWLEV